jgi:hypothetical protein
MQAQTQLAPYPRLLILRMPPPKGFTIQILLRFFYLLSATWGNSKKLNYVALEHMTPTTSSKSMAKDVALEPMN